MKRHQQILAGVLLVQLVLIAVVFWPRTVASGSGERAFPDLKTEDVVALRIADSDGNSVYLRRSGDGWVLPDAEDYPANASTITSLLDKVVGLTSDRLVTRTEASHQRLQVGKDNFVRRLTLELADGSAQILYLGTTPQYTTTHFRVEGQDETYLTSALTSWEVSALPASWIQVGYLSVPVDSLLQVTLENAQGSLTFLPVEAAAGEEGTAAREWTLADLNAGETADSAAIRSVISQAASVAVNKPLGKTELPAYGMASPNAVVTLKTADQVITLTIGAQTASGNYVVKGSNSEYFVETTAYTIERLVTSARADFITQPGQ